MLMIPRSLIVVLLSVVLHAQDLMPVPARLTPGSGRLLIDQSFRIAIIGQPDVRVRTAAARLVERLAKKTGIPLSPEILQAEPATLVIRCDSPGKPVQELGEDESYRLTVEQKAARLQAPNPLGVMHGAETFLQLVRAGREGFEAPAVEIADLPRFPWRGLLIDISRHFIPMDVMKRNIDGMAAVKMNVLHWHITDDQGFRIESKKYPRLHTMGSDGMYYTQDQAREIVAYARSRGIRVLPEFDMPGHTTSWLVGHPELGTTSGPFEIGRTWGVYDPCLDPTREEVYQLLDGFIGEMVSIFPDAYFHIGGDEVNGRQWTASQRVAEFKKSHNMKDNHDLQAYFNQRVQALVKKHGRIMTGWDEILHPALPKDIVVQSWRGQKSLAAAARQGYRGLLSFGYYLDLIQPASYHYSIDPMAGDAASLTAEEKARILGGESCMWAEYISAETVDSRIWPRNAVIAERLWSPQDVTDVPSMYRRMNYASAELERLGLTHRSSYRTMLERLVGERPPGPVQALADLCEPVKGYARGRFGKYTQFTPLNHFVNALRPESKSARRFSDMVDAVIDGRQPPERLRGMLTQFRNGASAMTPILESSFLLQEIEPVARSLGDAAGAGLDALDYLSQRKKPAPDWLAKQRETLDRVKQPKAAVLLMIEPAVRKLVEAAAK